MSRFRKKQNAKIELDPSEIEGHRETDDFLAEPDSSPEGVAVRVWMSRELKRDLEELAAADVRSLSQYARVVLAGHVQMMREEQAATEDKGK